MRKIAIIGAGQAGLQLGIALIKQHYHITLYSDRTPEEIQQSKILSNQAMFDSALQHERELGLDCWNNICPINHSVSFSLAQLGEKILTWKAPTRKPFLSVDQRLKFPQWMQIFQQLGGNLCIRNVNINDLQHIARTHDLTIISTGKKELSNIFTIDNKKTIFTNPMRKLACLYVNKVPSENNPGVHVNILPGIGEFFMMPGLTLNGPCEMMLFEGIPDAAFDCWEQLNTPEQHLKKAKNLLHTFLPWEAVRCEKAELTDENAFLTGGYSPVIRHPIFKLSDDQIILGMGDAVVLNDPIAGQGANNASKCADIYFQRIIERGEQRFDVTWMQNTFDLFWETEGQWSTQLSNSYLLPPTQKLLSLLKKASTDANTACQLASAFENPRLFFEYTGKKCYV